MFRTSWLARFVSFLVASLPLAGLLFAIPAAAKLRVGASTQDLASIAASVGGDLVEVFAIARPSSDPHRIEALPSYMVSVSRAQVFLKVVLPLARPALAVTALFSFMTAWNEFIMASTFMTDESKYTLPVLIQSSVGQFSADWGLFAAGAVVTSIPVMIAFYVLQKYLVGGLTAGAVKG